MEREDRQGTAAWGIHTVVAGSYLSTHSFPAEETSGGRYPIHTVHHTIKRRVRGVSLFPLGFIVDWRRSGL